MKYNQIRYYQEVKLMYEQISIKSAGKGEAVVCTEGQEIAVQS